jgi:hypothetical protein
MAKLRRRPFAGGGKRLILDPGMRKMHRPAAAPVGFQLLLNARRSVAVTGHPKSDAAQEEHFDGKTTE